MSAFINGKYAAHYGINGAEGSFYAYVTYEGRCVPGMSMKFYKIRSSAAKGAAKMLEKAAA